MSLEQKRQRVMQLVQTQTLQLQDKNIFIETLHERIRVQEHRFGLMESLHELLERQCALSDRHCELSDRANDILKEALEKGLAKRDMATGLLPGERSGTSDGKTLGSDKIHSQNGATLPCDHKNKTKADCQQLGESMTEDSGGSNEQAKDYTVEDELGRFVQCLKDRDFCPWFYMEGHCRDMSQCVYSQHKPMNKF